MALDVTRTSDHTSPEAWAARRRKRGGSQQTEWPISDEFTVAIASEHDIVAARERGRALARVVGF
jgi:hypothetical protein